MHSRRTNIAQLGSVAAVVLLAACASSPGPKFNSLSVVPEGKGLIYVFRNPRFGLNGTYTIAIDDRTVGVLRSGEFIEVSVEPGLRVVGLNPTANGMFDLGSGVRNGKVDVDVRSGATRFIRVVFDSDLGPCCAKVVFQPMQEREALPELRETTRAAQ